MGGASPGLSLARALNCESLFHFGYQRRSLIALSTTRDIRRSALVTRFDLLTYWCFFTRYNSTAPLNRDYKTSPPAPTVTTALFSVPSFPSPSDPRHYLWDRAGEVHQ